MKEELLERLRYGLDQEENSHLEVEEMPECNGLRIHLRRFRGNRSLWSIASDVCETLIELNFTHLDYNENDHGAIIESW